MKKTGFSCLFSFLDFLTFLVTHFDILGDALQWETLLFRDGYSILKK